MKNSLKQIGFLPLLVIFIFLGCNNDSTSTDDDGGDGGDSNRSLVKAITYTSVSAQNTNTTNYYLDYTTDGNLQSLEILYNNASSGDIENYNWHSGSLQTLCDRSWPRTGTFIRNSAGYVTSGEIEYTVPEALGSPITTYHNYTGTYNSNNQLLQIDLSISNNDPDDVNPDKGQTNFVWNDGNIILIEMFAPPGNLLRTVEYEYYTDKPETRDIGLKYLPFSNAHDFLADGGDTGGWLDASLRSNLHIYQNNNPMFLSKNLPKKITYTYHENNNSQVVFEHLYEFDDRGRVVLQTVTLGNVTEEHVYEYFD